MHGVVVLNKQTTTMYWDAHLTEEDPNDEKKKQKRPSGKKFEETGKISARPAKSKNVMSLLGAVIFWMEFAMLLFYIP